MSNPITSLPPVRVPVEVELSITVNGQPTSAAVVRPAAAVRTASFAEAETSAAEAAQQPIINTNYTDRKGFDTAFIGISTPLPTINDPSIVSQMIDGSGHVIPYEHFSIVMHADRRLMLYSASNVDYSPAKKFPEPGRDYSRKGLNGFDDSARGEIWLLDKRIPAEHQLDNRFYDLDRGAFDKGHVVRREDVCWGSSYNQVRQGNGDTFHSTNCTPQRANFNQSNQSGIWGELEDFVKAQADTEKLTLFAGPILADDDRVFDGQDSSGPLRVKIPSRYWKVVCANAHGTLEVFAFVLEQRTQDVTAAEFEVNAHWRRRMLSLADLEQMIPLQFPQAYHDADQFEA